MGDILRLSSDQFQKVYDRLQSVARSCNDENRSDVSSSLSVCDLASLTKRSRERLGVEMINLAGSKIFVRKDDLLQRLYQDLVSLDQSDGKMDGHIDSKKTPSELVLQEDLQESVAAVFHQRFSRAVFEVTKTTAPFGAKSMGSAFIIEKTEIQPGVFRYLLATDCHVVDTPNVQEVGWSLSHPTLPNRSLEAHVVGTHGPSDVALLEIELDENLPVLSFGNSELLRAGQKVVAIGNTIGRGLISIQGEIISPKDGMEGYPYSLIRPEIAVNHGNSGGPLFNATSGEVVGMVVLGDDRASTVANFSIPSNRILRSIKEIKASREIGRIKLGYWGFNFMPLTPAERHEISQAHGNGVWVTRVLPDSPAARAGLQPRDILLAVDGDNHATQINRVMDNYILTSLIFDSQPGTVHQLTVLREGTIVNLSLTAEATALSLMENTVHTEYPFAVRDIAEWERRLSELSEEGVTVILDDPRRPLFDHLIPNSIIQRVGGLPTPTVEEFMRVLQQSRSKARQEGQRSIRFDIYVPSSKEMQFVLIPVN